LYFTAFVHFVNGAIIFLIKLLKIPHYAHPIVAQNQKLPKLTISFGSLLSVDMHLHGMDALLPAEQLDRDKHPHY
jgi:hypothetical protein